MNRSSRGFGLAGVLFAVIIMVVTAFFGARAESAPMHQHGAGDTVISFSGVVRD
jgi:hypothetical protein